MNLTLGDTEEIIEYAYDYGCLPNQLAYILATAYHESWATMKPIRETRATNDKEVIRILDEAYANGDLSWVSSPYWRKDKAGKAWYGRGYVQLTFKYNYIKAGRNLNIDLTTDPDKALETTIAKKTLVEGMMEGWFTGRALPAYVSHSRSDYFNARKVVNGLNKATSIKNHAVKYQRLLGKEC